jgi:Aerotolerance regulator N-terminal/von Willebrand factor type A domain/CARDB
MSFLNTTILFLAGLALIPILIHLFNRQRVKRIEFSSVRYLKALQKTRMRRLKIKQLLLLILRTLIILALVVAFARPTTQGSYSSVLGSAAQASIVILIDNSLSMSTATKEGTLFEIATQNALEVCENVASGDELALISFNGSPVEETNGFTTNHSFIKNSINDLKPEYTGTDPSAAIDAALDLMETSKNLVKEIYLFSDLAGSAWQSAYFENLPEIKNLKIYVGKLQKKDYDNLKVTDISFGNSLIYPGRPVSISADITNEGSRRVDNLLISLFIDQKRLSQTDISIPANEVNKIKFTHTFNTAGEHTGYIEITDDDLIEDNRNYFTISIPDQIRVLTLYEKENDDLFLKLAFKPLPESPTQVELKSEPISRLASLDLFGYDCIILPGENSLSQANLSRLSGYVKSGGSLLMFLADDKNIQALDDRIMLPAFGSSIDKKLSVKRGEGFFRLSSLNFNHPIFSRFKEIDENYLPELDFFNIVTVTNPTRGNVLASFSTGSPAIIEAKWGNGRIMAVMSSPGDDDSDLISHPFFVTFINRTAEYLAYDLTRLRENFFTGETISKTLLNINPEKSLEIITPSLEKESPSYSYTGAELNLTIQGIVTNGIAEIIVDETSIEKFAVNVPRDESNGRFLGFKDIQKNLNEYEIIELKEIQDFGKIIQESRIGKELSKLFFILALLFLAAEMLLARGKPEAAEQTK